MAPGLQREELEPESGEQEGEQRGIVEDLATYDGEGGAPRCR